MSADGRTSAASRGYGRRWQRARLAFLKVNPLCAAHLRLGETVIATDVDHIKPHRGDYERFWDRTNWQSLCHACHSRKTAMLDRAGLGGVAPIVGCDVDGRPLDPAHWWNDAPQENCSELVFVDRQPLTEKS